MRRLLFLVPIGLFMVLMLYLAASLRPSYDSHILPSMMLDKPAPLFSLDGLNDQRLSRDSLNGQPAVINFFASWCQPCLVEHPMLMLLARDNHVRLFGIAYKDKPDDTKRMLARLGDPYRSVGLDTDGRVGLDYGVYGVPETYILDKTGMIRKKFVGPLSAKIIEIELLPLLKVLSQD